MYAPSQLSPLAKIQMPLYFGHRSVIDRWMCSNHQNSNIIVSFVSGSSRTSLCIQFVDSLDKIVVFRTHRRNLLPSTTQELRQILNLARPGRGTGESTIKMSISCTFCQGIEPYSLGEAAFCPYLLLVAI